MIGPRLLLEMWEGFALMQLTVQKGREILNTAGEYFSHHHSLADWKGKYGECFCRWVIPHKCLRCYNTFFSLSKWITFEWKSGSDYLSNQENTFFVINKYTCTKWSYSYRITGVEMVAKSSFWPFLHRQTSMIHKGRGSVFCALKHRLL